MQSHKYLWNIKNVIQDGGIPTKLTVSQLLLIIDYTKNWYHIKA